MGFVNKRSIDSITVGGETIYGGNVELAIPGGSLDPDTGEVTFPAAGGAEAFIRETKVIDATMLSNEYVILSTAPANKNQTTVEVAGLATQVYNIDFQVTADDDDKRLSWVGLGLAGLFELGDSFIIRYF